MAVREFRDRDGRIWRAWEITPDSIHPVTKAEDYLVDCYQLGWVVFETPDGSEKRRLCPYPAQWSDMSDPQLRELLASAVSVQPSRHALDQPQATAEHSSDARARRRATDRPVEHTPEIEPDVTDLRIVRSFRYPGGRVWSVYVVAHPEDGGRPVLRFAAGARNVDLRDWPRDWPDYANERLVELLRRAGRPSRSGPRAGVPRRRHDDPPP